MCITPPRCRATLLVSAARFAKGAYTWVAKMPAAGILPTR